MAPAYSAGVAKNKDREVRADLREIIALLIVFELVAKL
jgi:hypothetical protein